MSPEFAESAEINAGQVVLSETEQKRLKEAMPKIEEIFDTTNYDQIRELMLSRFKPLVDVGLVEEQLVLHEIEACAQSKNKPENKPEFIEGVTKLAGIYFGALREGDPAKAEAIKKVKEVIRVDTLKELERTVVDEIIDYEIIKRPNGEKIIKLHVFPAEKPGYSKLKHFLRDGFRVGFEKIAQIIKNDPTIVSVEAYSDIVFRGSETFEKMGFTLGEEVTIKDGKRGQGMSMPAELFVKKYGEKK